jgi:membrane dipeptidase
LILVDGHEDLAFNALAHGRDYLSSAHAIRAAEEGTPVVELNGLCMLGLREWIEARVAVILATVLTIPRSHAEPGELSYVNAEGAYRQGVAQLDLYRHWEEECEQVAVVRDPSQLGVVDGAVRLVLLMENADPIRAPDELGFWVEQGVRVIGPAWHSNRYTGDTRAGGGLTDLGRALLREMDALGAVLDLTHMSDEASFEALERFDGPVVATHANSRRTVDRPRLLSDRAVESIAERDGVVGVLPANWALVPEWKRGDPKDAVTLSALVDAIETVCEIAGDVRHVGIGTDFDGGQGAESAPAELDTIADLPKLADTLAARGYSDEDVAGIMGGNWLRVLRRALPTTASL